MEEKPVEKNMINNDHDLDRMVWRRGWRSLDTGDTEEGVAEEKPVEKVGGKVGERWTGRGRESWGEEEEGEGGEGE